MSGDPVLTGGNPDYEDLQPRRQVLVDDWTQHDWHLITWMAGEVDMTPREHLRIKQIITQHRNGWPTFATEDWARGYCDALLTARQHQCAADIASEGMQ